MLCFLLPVHTAQAENYFISEVRMANLSLTLDEQATLEQETFTSLSAMGYELAEPSQIHELRDTARNGLHPFDGRPCGTPSSPEPWMAEVGKPLVVLAGCWNSSCKLQVFGLPGGDLEAPFEEGRLPGAAAELKRREITAIGGLVGGGKVPRSKPRKSLAPVQIEPDVPAIFGRHLEWAPEVEPDLAACVKPDIPFAGGKHLFKKVGSKCELVRAEGLESLDPACVCDAIKPHETSWENLAVTHHHSVVSNNHGVTARFSVIDAQGPVTAMVPDTARRAVVSCFKRAPLPGRVGVKWELDGLGNPQSFHGAFPRAWSKKQNKCVTEALASTGFACALDPTQTGMVSATLVVEDPAPK